MRIALLLGFLISIPVLAKTTKAAPAKKSLVQPALKKESQKIKPVTKKFPPRAASGEDCH